MGRTARPRASRGFSRRRRPEPVGEGELRPCQAPVGEVVAGRMIANGSFRDALEGHLARRERRREVLERGRKRAGDRGGLRGAAGSGEDGLRVFMTGPAEEVFTCDLSDDLLRRLGWPGPPDG